MSNIPVNAFQGSVNIFTTLGIPGELAFDGPKRSKSYILYSSGTPNIIGNAFTVSGNGSTDPAGNSSLSPTAQVGGSGFFAGILWNPKTYASFGNSTNGPLGPTLTLPDYSQGELLTMGEVFVYLPGPANIGDLVTYDGLTGNLNSIPPTSSFTAAIAAGGSAGVPDVMTVSAITVGSIQVGALVTGTGVAGGTYVVSLGTGKGGTGTYNLSSINQQTVGSEVMACNNMPATAWVASSAYITTSVGVDTLHITTLTSGELQIGSQVFGTGVANDTVITAYGSGVGGTGTYTLNTSGQTVASSGSPEAMHGPANTLIPRCTVSYYASQTAGGVSAIKLTD